MLIPPPTDGEPASEDAFEQGVQGTDSHHLDNPPDLPPDLQVDQSDPTAEESTQREEEAAPLAVQQPIPFQMSFTTHGDEPEVQDELRTWYEEAEPPLPASGSSDPTPKTKSKPRPKPIIRERSPRSLRNRQVARSITAPQPRAMVHWNLQAQRRVFKKSMSSEQ